MNDPYSIEEQVILVNEQDEELGCFPKLGAHQEGLLHRAFSVFIFTSTGHLLLQQRADDKYHSPGLWSNACCSHPRPGETTHAAATRRLKEEMGMDCFLNEVFQFVYRVSFNNGLTEHEYDHVFFGTSDAVPELNPQEVKNWKHVNMEELTADMQKNPGNYTEWLKIAFDLVQTSFKNSKT